MNNMKIVDFRSEEQKLFEEYEETDNQLFSLWRDWDESGNYSEYLWLTEHERLGGDWTNEHYKHSINYLKGLIKEFQETGTFKKLKKD